jgi:serine/threonine protein phosphatase PrpC
MADAGLIDQSAVARHRQRHALTRYLGGGREVEAETQHLPLTDGDRLLFCSDGLTEMVSDSRIADVLSRVSDPDRACAELVELALEAGGKDNVTVIVANYNLPGDSHAG